VLYRLSLIALLILLAATAVRADASDPSRPIQVLISAECIEWFYGPDFEGSPLRKIKPLPDHVAWDPANAKPLSFKDPRTLVTFYVESDGRHIAAIDSAGVLMWVRDPFQEAKLCPYRTPRPVIYRISENYILPDDMKQFPVDRSHRFVIVYFDSSQFFLVDEVDGNFVFLGQN
jgi:hypothetical protein